MEETDFLEEPENRNSIYKELMRRIRKRLERKHQISQSC